MANTRRQTGFIIHYHAGEHVAAVEKSGPEGSEYWFSASGPATERFYRAAAGRRPSPIIKVPARELPSAVRRIFEAGTVEGVLVSMEHGLLPLECGHRYARPSLR